VTIFDYFCCSFVHLFFCFVFQVHREIEVSHWGNVAVEEHYSAEHRGAKLKGVFSRYEYQLNPNSGVSAIRFLEMWLPRDIVYTPGSEHDVWYRDEIGMCGSLTKRNSFLTNI
jgi:oligosaccharyltransferase complex subunit alpha (ribophorin I)